MDTSSSSAWNTLSRMPDGRPVHKRASSAPTPSLRASEISTIFNRNTSAVPHYGHESYQEYDGHTRNVHGTEIPIKVKKITCLGSGFVGGPISAVTAFKSDVEVTVVDINADRIAAWKSNILPIYEPGLHNIVCAARDCTDVYSEDVYSSHSQGTREARHSYTSDPSGNEKSQSRGKLYFSTDIDKAIADADLIFVCVNTPTKSNGVGKGAAADLGFVEAATRNIARVAKRNKIVVEKSTVPCRTAQSIRQILSANAHPGVQFDVLSNPEFLAEGTAVRDLLHPDRIIIGSAPTPAGNQAAASLAEVYAQWVPQERIITMNLWSSELSKLAANAMLAQRISNVNALSAICEATGADVNEVSHACGLDSRIGPGMLRAGPGFGGSCFRKDIFNIVYLSESLHLNEVADYWRAIINMNEYQKDRFTRRIISCLFNNLVGKKLAVLGFAFKKDTNDSRESPAITLVRNFVAERAHVAIYDPKVREEQIWRDLMEDDEEPDKLRTNISVCQTAYAACAGADAVVVVTEWEEFSNKTCPTYPTANGPSFALTKIDANGTSTPKLLTYCKGPRMQWPPSVPTAPTPNSGRKGSLTAINTGPKGATVNNEATCIARLDWSRIAAGMKRPMYVFDGRNILDGAKLEKLGFRVEAIGKASTSHRTLGVVE